MLPNSKTLKTTTNNHPPTHQTPTHRPPSCRALTSFLYNGGGPRYKVNAAFIWSVGTWDVAAIHPISTSEEGTYADWEIVKWMRWLSSKVPN